MPVDLEPTEIPGSLKYALAGIQHIEYFRGDPNEQLKAILRSLERVGVRVGAQPVSAPSSAPVSDPRTQGGTSAANFNADALKSSGALAVLPFDNFIAYWTLGRIRFTTGGFTEARNLFQKAIDIKPGFYVAHLDLKQAYDGLGCTAESAAQNGKIMDILPNYLLHNPDDARVRMFYAITLAETGRRDEAITEGAAALDLTPGDSLMLYNGACLYA